MAWHRGVADQFARVLVVVGVPSDTLLHHPMGRNLQRWPAAQAPWAWP